MKAIYDHQYGRVLGVGATEKQAWNNAKSRYDFNTGNTEKKSVEITDLAVKRLESVNFDDAEYSIGYIADGEKITANKIRI